MTEKSFGCKKLAMSPVPFDDLTADSCFFGLMWVLMSSAPPWLTEKSDEQSVHLALCSSRLEDEMHGHFSDIPF